MSEREIDLLGLLRKHTTTEHRRVEQHRLLRPLTTANLSLDAYSDIIAAFAGFYSAIETGLQPRLPLVETDSYRYQSRLPLLLSDLTYLPQRAIPRCDNVPLPENDSALVGLLYVLEGASQGGRVIAPRLAQTLALEDGAGASYFRFYRRQSWQRFRELVRSCRQGYDVQSALESARDTFNSLYSHLDNSRLRLTT